MVAVAIGGSALVGAGTSLIGGSQQAAGASNAQAIQEQQMAINEANEAPFVANGQAGNAALSQIFGFGQNSHDANGNLIQPGAALGQYGLPGSLAFNPTQAQLAATPGYQFDLAQGLQSTANSNAAQGRGISGSALKGAASYATGLANNTLLTQQGIFQQNLQNVLGPLQNLQGAGQASAANVGQSNTTGAANTGQAAAAVGQANSAGLTGAGNSLSLGALGYLTAGQNNSINNTLSAFPTLTGGAQV
jgi:hypothetical protein